MIGNRELFEKIAKSLISDFERIYLVNTNTNEYYRYCVGHNSHFLSEKQKEADFFAYIAESAEQEIYEEDRHYFQVENLKEKLLQQLQSDSRQSFLYRLVMNGENVYHIMRLIHQYVDGDTYFIIGVMNVDEAVREQIYMNKIAHVDALTGVQNKNSYQECEEEYQILIDKDEDIRFGLVICDVNNLKIINDTMGHKIGDELLQSAGNLLHNTFSHSTVYRIGGDEFVVLLKGKDYQERLELFEGLKQTIIVNQDTGEGPVMAVGMSIYRRETDRKVSDVFERADEEMYTDKESLKERGAKLNGSQFRCDKINKISAIRKNRLDSFFKVFRVGAEKGYIFFCDIKYDFSRWDRRVVDAYGLPSEYMYNAGGIWEERIHPDDQKNYHMRVEEVFNGDKEEFYLSYRVQNIRGDYLPCTCRALVIRNQHGEPEYFGGVLFI